MSAIINFNTLNQTEKYDTLSDKYNVMTTGNIVNDFKDRGFIVTDYKEARIRKEDRRYKQKHFVRMSLSEDAEMLERPEIVIHNSYDGSSPLKVFLGIYRFVCSNGMIVGDHMNEPLVLRHNNNSWEQLLYAFMESYQEKVNMQTQVIEAMKSYYMSYSDEVRFAEKAMTLREESKDVLDPRELVLVRRKEDAGKNLWLTFNKVQESLIQGLFQKVYTNEEGKQYYAKASILGDVNRIIAINNSLGQLAKGML